MKHILSGFLCAGVLMVSLLINSRGTAMAAGGDPTSMIDPTRFELTFSDEFDKPLSVSPWGPNTKWIAHTPWNGDFGDSKFANPVDGFPFETVNGHLLIKARKLKSGQWYSGLLSSVARDWTGFSQQYGYFEIRAKLPPGPGLWPAFWLIGMDRKAGGHTAEIDILEHYGHLPAIYSSTVSVWNRHSRRGVNYMANTRHAIPDGLLYRQFNTFGATVDHDWIVFYFNRKEIWRTPTQPEHRQPMLLLVNLALGPGWPIDKTPSPSVMQVDYVRVWKLP